MRKSIILAISFLVPVFFIGSVHADSYGRIHLTGISITENEYVFFADQYNNSYNSEECKATNWWWPANTAYAFWIPKEGNEHLYNQFMIAFLTGKEVWIDATPENLEIELCPCKIDMKEKRITIGDF